MMSAIAEDPCHFAPGGERVGMILLPKYAPIHALEEPGGIACSWLPTNPSTLFRLRRKARTSHQSYKTKFFRDREIVYPLCGAGTLKRAKLELVRGGPGNIKHIMS